MVFGIIPCGSDFSCFLDGGCSSWHTHDKYLIIRTSVPPAAWIRSVHLNMRPYMYGPSVVNLFLPLRKFRPEQISPLRNCTHLNTKEEWLCSFSSIHCSAYLWCWQCWRWVPIQPWGPSPTRRRDAREPPAAARGRRERALYMGPVGVADPCWIPSRGSAVVAALPVGPPRSGERARASPIASSRPVIWFRIRWRTSTGPRRKYRGPRCNDPLRQFTIIQRIMTHIRVLALIILSLIQNTVRQTVYFLISSFFKFHHSFKFHHISEFHYISKFIILWILLQFKISLYFKIPLYF